MPETEVIFFQEENGSCPLIEWLDQLSEKARDKCIVRIERLTAMGYELRRPEADFLRDGIYELRSALQGVQYRMLYFFHQERAVITHGFTKKQNAVPPSEIDLALKRKSRYGDNPSKHTYKE